MAQDDSVVWGRGYGAQIPNTRSETTASLMLTLETQSRKIQFPSCGIACHYFTIRIQKCEGSQVWGMIGVPLRVV